MDLKGFLFSSDDLRVFNITRPILKDRNCFGFCTSWDFLGKKKKLWTVITGETDNIGIK